MSGPDDFMSRWSRRKRAGPEPVEPEDATAETVPEDDPRSDEEILADLGLKHPDELELGDDVKAFMDAAVPDRMRRMALRQLWRTNPVLANVDGLVDYGEDFTDAATVIENLQTIYKVGRGMLRDEDETPPEAPEEVLVEAVDDSPEIALSSEEPVEEPTEEDAPDDAPEPADNARPVPEVEEFEARTVKRMQFRFSEE